MNSFKASLIVFFALVFVSAPYYLKSEIRAIEIEREIKYASFIGLVVFTGYDSTSISRSSNGVQVSYLDSISGKRQIDYSPITIMTGIKYRKIGKNQSQKEANLMRNRQWFFQTYRSRPDTNKMHTPHGYWPSEGDTFLLVLDSIGEVSLLAEEGCNGYTFWNPYTNHNGYTWFYFNKWFEPTSYPKSRKENFQIAAEWALRSGYRKGSPYYCFVSHKNFNSLLHSK